ncbi:hypothetical protein [Maritimibacter sp. DP1N21-5]|uniref:hypothetical protein n=1 Tax=Maritimibacter sp. DP1N21-5 TaxID=2836867 RepID=UPI001C445033|nr:hypothetical protein [Maritimibacter sp. DP1N21-5]MBV7408677.1 hypothetical protein [Maritimibacter sp. DP1N21-5]
MRVPLLLLSLVLAVSGCARSLTVNEQVFAKNLFGDTLDTSEVIVTAGLGVIPLPMKPKPEPVSAGSEPAPVVKAPDDLCVRRPSPRREWNWPAAFVLDSNIFFSFKYYPHDAFEGLPETAKFPSSILMAHELVHVWQWQNRETTGYTPFLSGGESIRSRDPYFFTTEGRPEFLTYGFEQQAAIVEDFVCYALFDPLDPVLDDLAAILRPVLPVDRFLASLNR